MSRLVNLLSLTRRGHSSSYILPSVHRLYSSAPTTGQYVTHTVKDGVAVVKFDNKNDKMNSLGEGLMNEIKDIMADISTNSSIRAAVLISGKTDNFIVGADIKMFDKIKTQQDALALVTEAHRFMNLMEASPKPIVAAIKGNCLGGGLEVALAAHYRIAVDESKTKMGLPEVMLGLLPGAGGTQRLPALINIPDAIQMALTGKNVSARAGKRLGLVDQVVLPIGAGLKSSEERTLEYLEEVAIETAKNLASGKLKIDRKRPLIERLTRKAMDYEFARNFVFNKAKETVMKMSGGLYPSPLKILEVIKVGIEKGTVAGSKAEAEGFAQLMMTPHHRALVGLFHGQTHCKKNQFGKPQKKVEKVGVLGAGLMGAGIATVSIDNAGHRVVMKDANIGGLSRGEQQLRGVLDTKVKRKRMDSFTRDVKLSHLETTLDYSRFKDCDVVIEAVVENLKVKHQVLADIEAITRPDCIFATNTSAISIASIAEGAKRPENVIGMHYFSPVEKMPLLEIVITDKTSQEAKSRAVEIGLKQGKVVITVKDSPAFYTTRILAFLMAEVMTLLAEGVKPHDLDKLTKKMGFPIGLVTLVDEVGHDTGMHITKYLQPIFGSRFSPHSAAPAQELVDSGACGRKTGKGWFLYDGNKKSKGPRPVNPKAEELLKKYHIPPKRQYSDEEHQMRMMTRFTNEAALCLQEGILANPVEGDIGAVFGLGYPPFHGGPFRYLDEIGADRFVRNMEQFEPELGGSFVACDLLKDMAKDSTKKFHPKK